MILASAGHSQLEFIRWRVAGMECHGHWMDHNGFNTCFGRGDSTCKGIEGDRAWHNLRMLCHQALLCAWSKGVA